MSYYFEMSFKDIKRENLFNEIANIKSQLIKERGRIIGDNLFYAPSSRFKPIDESDLSETTKTMLSKMDEYWLYSLFSFRALYWKNEGLLGLVGTLPENIGKEYKTIVFQNSTDQDYKYESWSGIKLFKNIVDYCKKCTKSQLTETFDWDLEEDIDEEDLEYYRRSAAYKMIYAELDLDNWLYNNDPEEIKEIRVCSIKDYEDLLINYNLLLRKKRGF